jgi:hypothetical protein
VFTGGHTRFEGTVLVRDGQTTISGKYRRPIVRQAANFAGLIVALYMIIAPLSSLVVGAPVEAGSVVAVLIGGLILVAVAITYAIGERTDRADIAAIESLGKRVAELAGRTAPGLATGRSEPT